MDVPQATSSLTFLLAARYNTRVYEDKDVLYVLRANGSRCDIFQERISKMDLVFYRVFVEVLRKDYNK